MVIFFITFYLCKKLSFNVDFKLFCVLALPLFSISITVFVFPKLAIFIMIISGFIVFLTSFPYEIFKGFQFKKQEVLIQFLEILASIGILDFLAHLFISFFFLPSKRFNVFLSILITTNLLYLLVSRYIYLRHCTGIVYSYMPNDFVLYIIVLLGLSAVYLRILLAISLSLTVTAFNIRKDLLSKDILLAFGEEPDSDSVPNPMPGNSGNNSNGGSRNIFNFGYNRHNHYNYFPKNGNGFKYAGVVIGFGSLALGTWALHVQQNQLRILEAQLQAQLENNLELKRQNDLQEVNLGIKSKEDYIKKHHVPPKT